jgi:hypothetical protein
MTPGDDNPAPLRPPQRVNSPKTPGRDVFMARLQAIVPPRPAGIIVSMASVSPVRARQPRRGTAVQQARLDRDMTQAQAIAALTRLASRHGIALPSSETLKRRLSSWENKPIVPEPQYRMLLRELYGRTNAELGFNTDIIDAGDGHEDALTEVRARLARSQGVDGALLDELDQNTHRLRLLDRRFGAAMVLDQITSQINLVRQLMTHTVLSRHRSGLARILADASALAGWQALDTGAIMRAWQHFDLARSSGQESGDEAVYAHALGEQSYALADLERFPDASGSWRKQRQWPRCRHSCGPGSPPPRPRCTPTSGTAEPR